MMIRKKAIVSIVITAILIFIGTCYAAKLRSIYHCKHYSHVKNKIANPKTDDHIFPDTLTWSNGGTEQFGLRLLIHCEKNDCIYKSGDLIGIRSGILNCSDDDVHLAVAHYSPNKHRVPPEYTLYVDGPERALRIEYGRGYLGDDAIWIGERRKPPLYVVSPGKIFNPSPDSLYYNTWNGILHLTESGIYRVSCSYSFDSLVTNMPVEELTTLYSDTIEIIVKWDPCAGCLFW